ncbi:MAG: hypothetical protein KF787_01045 [Phycisphaeraceae bacterium]|nr:hypothetical protein [Phycisphaerae bacterium]MBX3391209.1 hypothetical protein [Phycisphaeraceae bacterium]
MPCRLLLAIILATIASPARAQNPIQWMGNSKAAVNRAAEHSMPLLFWVTEKEDALDDDDLRDAQSRAFRDPAVSALAQRRFVPVRVSRGNSRVVEEAQKLGLPTDFGLYIAIISPEGKLIRRISPGDVADAQALATSMVEALHTYLNDLYDSKLRPVITSSESSKADVRDAVQTVWRLGILSADKDCIALLERGDLTPTEHARLCTMLGAMATPACIEELLGRAAAGDEAAANALNQAEAGALETLLKELPPEHRPPEPRQVVAYRAACRISHTSAKPDSFWPEAQPGQRRAALESLRRRAEPILDFWNHNTGRWR